MQLSVDVSQSSACQEDSNIAGEVAARMDKEEGVGDIFDNQMLHKQLKVLSLQKPKRYYVAVHGGTRLASILIGQRKSHWSIGSMEAYLNLFLLGKKQSNTWLMRKIKDSVG